MLALELTFLTGRYVATAYDDRNRAEWPPHPARLFSALVAAHFDASDPSKEEREALKWLEEQGPPAIHASDASSREIATVFVPVNDPTVVGSLDDEVRDVERAREEAESASDGKAKVAAEKKLAKQRARLVEVTRKAIAPVPAGKETKDGPITAASILPESRKKQPRTFPSVTPEDPRVVFAWPGSAPSEERRGVLDALAARVVRLGHSSSLVSVRLAEATASPAWVPDDTGEVYDGDDARTLRVASRGQTVALDELFALQPDAPGRVMPAAFQRYVRPQQARPAIRTTVFGDDWIVLARLPGGAGGPRLPSTRVVDVARVVRSAMLASYGEGAPEVLSGHDASGGPSRRPHVAYLPLPYVGNKHADGAILGIAVVLPRAALREERAAVSLAVERWHVVHGRAIGGDDERRAVPVHLGRAGELHLAGFEERPRPQSPLNVQAWCRPSRMWATATPIALDRNPGDLRSKDTRLEAAAYAEAEGTIAACCSHIGLPKPARVTVLPAAPLAGADKARAFPPFLTGKPPIQRVLVHAVLRFDEMIRGPVLLGSGRFLGLGLLRPIEDDDA